MEVYAEDTLTLKVSGAAEIKYKGTPKILREVSGVLDLINAN
jgi:hypothetical protein